jgi:hypothetical protein
VDGNWWRRAALVLVPSFAIGLWAAYQILHYTRHGLYLTPDSASYMGMADNIRHGRGPTVPFSFVWDRYSIADAIRFRGRIPSSHFPPGYSIALTVVAPIAGSLQGAARVINVACVVVNVVLIGLLTAMMTRFRSVIVATIPAAMMIFVSDTRLFVLAAPGWIPSYKTVASEPLFTAFLTGAVIVGGLAISRTGRQARYWLIAATVFTAAALLTRYTGGAAVLALAIALVWFDRVRARADRVRRAAIFTVLSIAPVGAYVIGHAIAGAGGARMLGYHRHGREITDTLELIGRSLFPIEWPAPVLIVLVIALSLVAIAAAVWLPRVAGPWHDDDEGTVLLRLSLLMIPCYIAVIVFTETFLDNAVEIAPRYFVGLRGIAAAAFVAGAYRFASTYVSPKLVAAVLAIGVLFVVRADWRPQNAWWTFVPAHPQTQLGRALTALPKDAVIWTNAPDYVYEQSKRPSLLLPSRLVYLTSEKNADYAKEVNDLTAYLKRRGGYLFYAGSLDPVVGSDELGNELHLEPLATDSTGRLYAVSPR